ncbi:Fasciclin-like arabinogalactan protein 7 [Platanthera zijinensis]|uniref:Fasciclin-like arabinogalactan protein 7 n=1 Tax=Platanthera zijinensis TaxID=2320716 RepID=A0AAP0BCP6_9ASPA
MALNTAFAITAILSIWISPITAQSPPPPFLPPSSSPAPSPAPHVVNLTNLLSLTGPFITFLDLLLRTDVIQTFQNQANNSKQGITIFVPTDSAFAELEKPSLSNLTKDQLRSLLLYHAFPKFYSLSDFKNLSSQNPVSTFAGGQYTLNLTDTSGLIRVGSDWSNPQIRSSVFSTYPVAVYEIKSVLLPKAIVTTPPALTPAPAPAPDLSPASDSAPASQKGRGEEAPKSSETGNSNSSPHKIVLSGLICFLTAAWGAVVLMV